MENLLLESLDDFLDWYSRPYDEVDWRVVSIYLRRAQSMCREAKAEEMTSSVLDRESQSASTRSFLE